MRWGLRVGSSSAAKDMSSVAVAGHFDLDHEDDHDGEDDAHGHADEDGEDDEQWWQL